MARPWTREELLVAFSLYCRLPFGRYHRGNPEVKQVAAAIGRTPSSVAMRLSNFASLDPAHQERGIKGLSGTGPALQRFWEEVTSDWTQTAIQCEQAWHAISEETTGKLRVPQGPTETEAVARVRLVQGFFRRTVLASYRGACAICGVRPAELLTAGHIIPWNASEARRADPTNGLCLCALHDRAFDSGLIAVDENRCVITSAKLAVRDPSPVHRAALLDIKGKPLTLPNRYHPDHLALKWHRDEVFVA